MSKRVPIVPVANALLAALRGANGGFSTLRKVIEFDEELNIAATVQKLLDRLPATLCVFESAEGGREVGFDCWRGELTFLLNDLSIIPSAGVKRSTVFAGASDLAEVFSRDEWDFPDIPGVEIEEVFPGKIVLHNELIDLNIAWSIVPIHFRLHTLT